MRFAGMGKSIGFSIGKMIGRIGQKERQAAHRNMLARQNAISKRLWLECKEKIRTLSDEEFEELANFINDEVCTGPRKYTDPRHEVYSRLKHDMISYQYEKVLKKLNKKF
jgi:hypothetical protein